MLSVTSQDLAQIYAMPILIVDDNQVNCILIERALHTQGFTTLLSVSSAEEAFARLAAFNPQMVILDVMMPGGMDGFACCAALRAMPQYRDLPVLIQTAITEPEMRVKAFTMGATDFVSKPVYPDELCARVLAHLEKRHALQVLQRYKLRMDAELESARQLQQAILPSQMDREELARRCQFDVASFFEPSSEVGGDFWGMKSLFPHQTAFWLVDFSGHGVASALNAFRLQAYMKEFAPMAARPGEYLSHLNEKLLHLLLRGQFATMFYGIVDTQSNQLLYACACAPHPLILRAATGKAEQIDGTGNPLGIGLHTYTTHTIPFAPGDTLLLYSDVLTETANTLGETITEQSIMEQVASQPGASAAALCERVLSLLRTHAAGAPLADDLTLAVIRRDTAAMPQGT